MFHRDRIFFPQKVVVFLKIYVYVCEIITQFMKDLIQKMKKQKLNHNSMRKGTCKTLK